LYLLPSVVILLFTVDARGCPPAIHPTVRRGYKLTRHHIVTYSYLGVRDVCIEACSAHNHCNSVNFYQEKRECELNSANHVSHPQDMKEDIDSLYTDYTLRPPVITP